MLDWSHNTDVLCKKTISSFHPLYMSFIMYFNMTNKNPGISSIQSMILYCPSKSLKTLQLIQNAALPLPVYTSIPYTPICIICTFVQPDYWWCREICWNTGIPSKSSSSVPSSEPLMWTMTSFTLFCITESPDIQYCLENNCRSHFFTNAMCLWKAESRDPIDTIHYQMQSPQFVKSTNLSEL